MLKSILSNIRNIFTMKDVKQQQVEKTSIPKPEVGIAIFFDTNQLGERFTDEGSGNMLIHRIKASSTFYDIKKYLHTYGLLERIQLFIPDISLREYKQQAIEIYQEHTKSIEPQIDAYRKVFGDILSIDFHFRYNDLSEFDTYISSLIDTFLLENQCEIAHNSDKEHAFDRFVNKVINREAPFSEAHKNGKKYKDAGLKDAIIEDTITLYAESTKRICILVSEDNDWGKCFKKDSSNIFVCKTTEQVVQILNRSLGLSREDLIAKKILNNPYLKETVITMASVKYEETAPCEILSIDEMPEDENFILRFKYILDSQNYNIECVYEESSNSIISSDIVEDGE